MLQIEGAIQLSAEMTLSWKMDCQALTSTTYPGHHKTFMEVPRVSMPTNEACKRINDINSGQQTSHNRGEGSQGEDSCPCFVRQGYVVSAGAIFMTLKDSLSGLFAIP